MRELASWRFSLRSLLLVIAYIAFVLAWLRYWMLPVPAELADHSLLRPAHERLFYRFYPGPSGVFFAAVLLIAAFQLRRREGSDSAWILIALAWYGALAILCSGIIDSYEMVSGISPRAWQYRRGFEHAVISAVTLPLIATIPNLHLLLFRYRSYPRSASLWIYGALLIAIVDAILLVTMNWLVAGIWGN